MSQHKISGDKIVVTSEDSVKEPLEPTREHYFLEGYRRFSAYLGYKLDIDIKHECVMNPAIKDIALLFGSTDTVHNGELQSLKELVTVLSEDQCDETLRLTGLKVLRAILYLQPNGMVTSPKSLDDEYKRHLDNLPPSSVGEYEFSLLQSKMAKLGCVSVVIKCIESQNQEIVMASLQLAVTLLEGGNTVVQQLFATILTTPISGPFFLQLKALFVDSSEAIKAEKRKIKFAHAEKIVLQKAGICHIEHGEVGLSNLTKGRAQMFETIKFLRGMCTV